MRQRAFRRSRPTGHSLAFGPRSCPCPSAGNGSGMRTGTCGSLYVSVVAGAPVCHRLDDVPDGERYESCHKGGQKLFHLQLHSSMPQSLLLSMPDWDRVGLLTLMIGQDFPAVRIGRKRLHAGNRPFQRYRLLFQACARRTMGSPDGLHLRQEPRPLGNGFRRICRHCNGRTRDVRPPL